MAAIVDHGVFRQRAKSIPFMVMPRYAKSLRRVLEDGMPHEKVLGFFAQILDGVEAAHLLKVWHRDLKPHTLQGYVSGPLILRLLRSRAVNKFPALHSGIALPCVCSH